MTTGSPGLIRAPLPSGEWEEVCRLGIVKLCWILVFYASLMAVGLGSERALTRHEVFAAQPAREMLESGSEVPAFRRWMVQQFGGVPRYEKPPAMSWMIAASFSVFGEREWAARLPAVVAGGAIVWMVAAWAARQFGQTAGIVAGLMQSTFFYTLMQARLAEVDMPLAAVVTGGMMCLGWAWAGRRGDAAPSGRKRALLGWGFAVLAGVSMAMKGPVGPGMLYVGALAFAVWMRSPQVAWWVLHPGRLAVFAVVAAGWPVAAYRADPAVWDFWVKELTTRTSTGRQGAEPWWFYTWNVPMILLPWVLVAPASVGALRRWSAGQAPGEYRAVVGHALAWLLGGVVLLSLAADKSKHYAIPALAGLTPLLAIGLLEVLRHQHAQPVRWYGRVTLVWALAFSAAVVAVVKWAPEGISGPAAVVVGLLGVGGAVCLQLERLRRPSAQLAAIFLTAWATLAGVNGLLTPASETFWRFRSVALMAREHIPAGKPVTLVNLGMHPVAFYLPLPIRRLDSAGGAPVPASGALLMLPQDDVDDLAEQWGVWLEGLTAGGTTGRKRDDALILCRVVRVTTLSSSSQPDSMGSR